MSIHVPSHVHIWQAPLCKHVNLIVAVFTLLVTLVSSFTVLGKAIFRLQHGIVPIQSDVMLGVAIGGFFCNALLAKLLLDAGAHPSQCSMAQGTARHCTARHGTAWNTKLHVLHSIHAIHCTCA